MTHIVFNGSLIFEFCVVQVKIDVFWTITASVKFGISNMKALSKMYSFFSILKLQTPAIFLILIIFPTRQVHTSCQVFALKNVAHLLHWEVVVFSLVFLGVVHKWCHPLRREGESAKRWHYSISLFSKMDDKGEGRGQKSQ